MATPLSLLVEVPFCSFRPYASREYQDTYPVPTPSSVYGMLLSLIGVPREEKARHRGVELALAVEQLPQRAKVFRKLRRGSELGSLRPDYQDLLLDLRLWVWLRSGDDQAAPPMTICVKQALDTPSSVTRFGGLSLGESSYLVDSISDRRSVPSELIFLRPDEAGFYSLPVWVDHENAQNTRLRRFSLEEKQPPEEGLLNAWFKVDA